MKAMIIFLLLNMLVLSTSTPTELTEKKLPDSSAYGTEKLVDSLPKSSSEVLPMSEKNTKETEVSSTMDPVDRSATEPTTESTTPTDPSESSQSEATATSSETSTSISEEKNKPATSTEATSESSVSDTSKEEPHDLELLDDAPYYGNDPSAPLPIYDAAGLRKAINDATTYLGVNETLYVKFQNDITYNPSDATTANFFNITRNLVIDGGKFHLYYGSTITTFTAVFRVKRSGLTVTVKNLNYGDEAHSNSNYYGMFNLYIDSGNTPTSYMNLVYEDFNYYASRGAQPFYLSTVLSSVTFKGTNSFYDDIGESSQEWMQGNNVTFAEGSTTRIYHRTALEQSFIFTLAATSPININVEKGARVEIDSNKNFITFGTNTINFNIAEGAIFKYHYMSDRLSFTNMPAPSLTKFDLGRNARVEFVSDGAVLNTGGVQIISNDAAEFLLKYQRSVPGVGTNRVWTFTDRNTDGYPYYWTGSNGATFKSLSVIAQKPGDKNYPDLRDVVFTDLGPVDRVLYNRQIEIQQIKDEPDVGIGYSRLKATITGYQPSVYGFKKMWYKLSTVPLWDPVNGDPRSETAQAAIEAASGNQILASGEADTSSVTFPQVLAGKYYLYMKMEAYSTDDTSEPRFTQTSPWTLKEVVVPRSKLAVSVPTKLAFTQQRVGSFIEQEDIGKITNLSNYPLIFTVTGIKETKTNPIRLLPELTGGKDELSLDLVSSADEVLGPLKIGENNVAGMRLVPYTGKDIFFRGNFSGKQVMHREVGYQLEFKLTDEEGNVPSGG